MQVWSGQVSDDYFFSCFATCASNIYDHEIISNYGTGAVVATCSENNYALGCGQKSGINFYRLFWLENLSQIS